MQNPQQVTPAPQQFPAPSAGVLAGSDSLRYLIEREDIPEEVRARFWVWASPDLILSNVTISIINRIILPGFDYSALMFLNDCGETLDYKVLQWLSDLRASVILALLRSTGGEERERKIIATGFVEQKSQYQEHLGNQKKGWFR